MLLSELLDEFLVSMELRQLSKRTIRSNRNILLKLFKYLDEEFKVKDLEKVKAPHLKSYIKYLTDQGRKETYVNSIIHGMRAFFLYCVQEEYILESVAHKVRFQKEMEPVITTFTDEEVVRMVKYYSGRTFLDIRNKTIMVLLFETGLRNSELCEIEIANVKDNVIMILGKGKKERYIPITNAVKMNLMKYLRARENYSKDKPLYEMQYLFISQKGKKLTKEAIERIVRECKKPCKVREDIRCSPHTCRHYYAQKQLKNGYDMYTVSRMLGHSSIETTKRYLKSMRDEDIVEMAAKKSPLSTLGVN